jgi:aspartyl/glutamyl-tRNA(Asn/Gln) amidotransferase C subunit|tara:strand:+ start:43288 stop:43575 length:288 start_codon:yes stop_codon:yes gene_type:complete
MITPDEVKKLTNLAMISLSQKELEELHGDFESILEYVSHIQKAPKTDKLSSRGEVNVMREDGDPHESGMYSEALLKALPKQKDGYMEVKKILTEK